MTTAPEPFVTEAPGGIRIVSDRLGAVLGQSIVVENRVGAGGTTG